MSLPTGIEPPENTSLPEPEAHGGLEDPRTIHPSPGEVVPDPVEPPEVDEKLPAPGENRTAEEAETGIVDPRIDRIGPDL